jgi:hypothetical protein
MNRRTHLEDMDYQLERQCFNLNPEWWKVIYKDQVVGDTGASEGIPLTEDDLDELDRYMEEQERKYREAQQAQQSTAQQIDAKLFGTHRMNAGDNDWRDTYRQASALDWGAWQ